MKRYELTNTKPLAYEPDYRMVADEDGEYVLYAEAQGRIDELKTALENVRNQERERYADALVARATRTLAMESELRNIANAKMRNFTDYHEFMLWAQSRARHTLESTEVKP